MDRATTLAAATAAIYATGTLVIGALLFWDDTLLLGAVLLVGIVLTPACFLVTRNRVRAQLASG